MARAFERFASEPQFKRLLSNISIEKAKDYAPAKGDADYKKGSDAPWIRRFAGAGGRFIISGDTDMMWEPHERLALVEEGMVVFFFSNQWSGWKFFRKCALLMVWWPTIIQKMKRGHKGKFWRIPSTWAEDGKLYAVSTQDRHLVRIERQKAAQKKVAKARKIRRANAASLKQSSFEFGDGK